MEKSADDSDRQAGADTENHVPDLADGVERKQPLIILLYQGHHHRQHNGYCADCHKQDTEPRSWIELKHIQRNSGKQINAEEFFE